jgi:hypothetical protein
MKDKTDKYAMIKEKISNLPFRTLVIGKTGSGKSGILGNLLLRKEFYRDDFSPDNIYIFSGSKGDKKVETIMTELDISETQLFLSFDEEMMRVIYDISVNEYNEDVSNGVKPKNVLFVFDDLSYTNRMNKPTKDSILEKIFSNGRKYLISTITISQKLSSLSTNCREQCSSLILFQSSNKQLELLDNDMRYGMTKKSFMKMVQEHTKNRFSFIVFMFDKPFIYHDDNFNPIDISKY